MEYIEGTGSQWLDTGIAPTLTLTTQFGINANKYTGEVYVGAYSDDSTDYRFFASNVNYTYFDYSSGRIECTGDYALKVGTYYDIEMGNFYLKMNGKIIGQNSVRTGTLTSSTIKLFYYSNTNSSSAKIYYLTMYDNGALIGNFIPCKNASGVVGMYDTVTQTFFESKTSTPFVAGPVVAGSNVPNGYTKLEYIKNEYGAYLDTGFSADNNTRVQMEVSLSTLSVNQALFCCRDGMWANTFSLFWIIGNNQFRADYSAPTNFISNVTPTINEKFSVDYNKNSITINGVTTQLTETTFSPTLNLWLFASYQESYSGIDNYMRGNLYSCLIYDNDVLVRNFIPCKNASGVVGLYDTVTHTFYSSASSTQFTAGPVAS